MSQKLVPLNGGRTSIETTIDPPTGVYLSPQYVSARRLEPSPTEWVENGRPIYDRLPAVSERYKLYFGLDGESAFTYIRPGAAYSGPGSLQVQRSGENKYLVIQNGSIVWRNGTVEVDPVIIDLKLVGLQSTKYLIAYQLYSDDSPFVAEYEVEDYSLSGEEMNVASSTDQVTGWRYIPTYAFTNSEDQSWRNRDNFFIDFEGDPYLYWQTEFPNSYSTIRLRCPANSSISGTASLFYQNCLNSDLGEKYCSEVEWLFQQTVSVQSDSIGQFFEFNMESPTPQNGWKVTWSDPKVSINGVTVSGTLSLRRRPSTAITYTQLVAYPQESVPRTITNLEGEEVPLVFCKLALVDTNEVYEATRVQDARETVSTDYQPIADWLTGAWDESLTNLYTQVKNYVPYWIQPDSCLKQEYGNLEKFFITVER